MLEKPHIDIDYTARLARIALSEGEKARLSAQLESILGYVNKLDELDTSSVEPMAHPHSVVNVWQADLASSPLPVDAALRNAPDKRHNMIVVPKIVE